MAQLTTGWKNYLYVFTILFFSLGLFNIIFAWLGFACMILPFILLAKNKKKTWCQGYCPRASLFGKLFQKHSLTGKAGPNWLIRGKAKWVVLAYFVFNMVLLIATTYLVSIGGRQPIENIRFLVAFELPWNIPQLLGLGTLPDWVSHLAFTFYSMMFTTTIIGLLLAWIFKPRTWCTVCPVNTVSDLVLHNNRK